MAWLRREDKETCRECWEEADKLNIPALKKIQFIEQYPCSKHGHPGFLSPVLTAWVEFFIVILPYCTPQTLPIELISKICQEYGIKFTEAFEMLTIILKAFMASDEDTNQNIRNQGSATINET